jgi:hypothetical protein
MHDLLFVLAVSLLFVHELDAVQRREWRIFPVLSMMPEEIGMRVFIWAHVPLFAAILWFAAQSIARGGDGFSLGLSGFCVVHAFLHLAYERHPKCEFRNPLSRAIIWLCALAGAAAVIAFYA